MTHVAPGKASAAFALQLASGLFSAAPLAVSRYRSREAGELVASLADRGQYDHVVCDFLAAAPNVPRLDRAVLFQHNVETTIWERRAENAATALERAFFRPQARRMFAYERSVCRAVRRVIAVSEIDAQRMRSMFGAANVCDVPTGVDIEYFSPQASPPSGAEPEPRSLVFVGSMDWAPNVDGVLYFLEQILPLIRKRRPECPVAIVGRHPPATVRAAADCYPGVLVTGAVADVRPYLWGAAASIVPLRIGGGTRLKIFESMAARVPVVATFVGAKGLPVTPGENALIGDDPATFAAHCVEILEDTALAGRIAANGRDLAQSRFSWEQVSRRFEEALGG